MGQSADEADKKALSSYCTLMEEVKRRTAIIDRLSLSGLGLDDRTTEEFCLLHLRMICELIALGCLVAHGDIKETRGGKLRAMYQADGIIKSLAHLHGNFYPRPGREVRHPTGEVEIEDIKSDYLTQSALVNLYHKCGASLHIGSMDRLPVNWNRMINLDKIRQWSNRIKVLLSHHRVALVRKDHEYWISMDTGPEHKVQGALFQKIGSVEEFLKPSSHPDGRLR